MKVFREDIIELIRSYLLGTISKADEEKLEQWMEKSEQNRNFCEEIKQDKRFAEEFPKFCDVEIEKGWVRFERQIKTQKQNLWLNVLKYAAVIIFPLTIGLVMWLLFQRGNDEIQTVSEMIEPGKAKATLVLSGGETVILNNENENEIEIGEGLKAKHTIEGLVYDHAVIPHEEELKYNTLKVPRGGEFHLTLSDGTVVTLNSATILKYPVIFEQQRRKVFLDGEAYFEVKTDSARPFYVETQGMQLRVYGTSFNMNTHRKGEVQTVLVEGKVGIRLSDSGQEYALKPGELACFNKDSKTVEIRSVNVEQYIAWTRGIFTFEDETLEQIMNTLSLWYNVEVFFQTDEVKRLHFSGHLERYDEIQNILNAITEATDVKFSVKERTIIVSQ